MSDRAEFEKQFPVPEGVYWESWGNGDGQYEAVSPEHEEFADVQQARLQGWQAARAQSVQGAEPADGQWLIQMRGDYLVTRGVWECPDHRGYTNDINEAGRYSEEEAKEAERMMPDKCKAVRLPVIYRQPAQQGSVPEYDLPKGYIVRFDDETGWHWYDDVNDRTTDCVFGSKADAAIGAWKDCSLTRWFDVDGLASYIERNFDPYLAEKVHYSSGPDSRSWQLERFSLSTDAYNPKPFPDCLGEFLRQFLFTSTPQPQGDGWVKCSERLPTEEDQYVWLYFKGHGPYGVSEVLWRWDDDIGAHGETHWKPTGLKRPKPPQKVEGDE